MMYACKCGRKYPITCAEVSAFKEMGYEIVEIKSSSLDIDTIADAIVDKVMKDVDKIIAKRVEHYITESLDKDCNDWWKNHNTQNKLYRMMDRILNERVEARVKDYTFRRELINETAQLLADKIIKSKMSNTKIATMLINLLTESEGINE